MAKTSVNAIEVNDVDDELDIWIMDQETGRLKYVLQLRTNDIGTISLVHTCPEIRILRSTNITV